MNDFPFWFFARLQINEYLNLCYSISIVYNPIENLSASIFICCVSFRETVRWTFNKKNNMYNWKVWAFETCSMFKSIFLHRMRCTNERIDVHEFTSTVMPIPTHTQTSNCSDEETQTNIYFHLIWLSIPFIRVIISNFLFFVVAN